MENREENLDLPQSDGLRREQEITQLSGHRPITFEQRVGDLRVPAWSEAIDLLLVEENQIVASSAGQGRYAASELLFARDVKRYADIWARCAGSADIYALPHGHAVALVCGVLANPSDLLLVLVIHGNTKRTRRVLKHCFGITMLTQQAPDEIGGLRQSDRPLYQELLQLQRWLEMLALGAGKALQISTYAQLKSLLDERMNLVFRMFGLPHPVLGDATLPFPCAGEIRINHLIADMLCLALAIRECGGADPDSVLREQEPKGRLYPSYAVSLADAHKAEQLCRHPAMMSAYRLAIRNRTMFSCQVEIPSNQVLFQIAQLCPRHQTLYTLRSRTQETLDDDSESAGT